KFGQIIRQYLPYPTPLSVHGTPDIMWSRQFDPLPQWHDHHIVQKKMKTIAAAADAIVSVRITGDPSKRHKPTIDDELSYEGDGDKHSEQDTIESHLGAFLGGGYGSTGLKTANKIGHYFWGAFDPNEHTSADNLKFLRETIDQNITFWQMS